MGLQSGALPSGPGIGDRADLWSWVAGSMGGSWTFGKGPSADFVYEVHPWQIKTSIESQYLSTLYHNGVVGLLLLIFSYIAVLLKARRREYRRGPSPFESKLPFSFVVFSILLVYFLCELGVQETDMARTYAVWLALFASYCRLRAPSSISCGMTARGAGAGSLEKCVEVAKR